MEIGHAANFAVVPGRIVLLIKHFPTFLALNCRETVTTIVGLQEQVTVLRKFVKVLL